MTPPRAVLRLGWAIHRGLRRLSGGRLGTSTPQGDKLGTLFLHTVGRKSGKPRANALFYMEDRPNLVVVASNAGEGNDPAWWLNLRAAPDAEVEISRRRSPVRARPATVEETARLWPRLVARYPEFGAYRAKARRPIDVVILEPG